MPPSTPHRLASDRARRRRGEERDQRRDLLRLDQAARGQHREPARHHVGRHRPHLLGRHQAREDGVGGDAVADVLGRDREDHPHHTRLRRRVGDLPPQAGARRGAGDHDDPPEAPLAHPGQTRLHGPERPGQVDVDVALPLLGRHAVRRRDGRGDGRVGDAHVDVAERGEGVARDVEAHVAACGHVGRHDLHAVAAEALGDRGAESACRSRDQRLHRVGSGLMHGPEHAPARAPSSTARDTCFGVTSRL